MPETEPDTIQMPRWDMFDDLSEPELQIPTLGMFDDLMEPTSQLAATAPSGPQSDVRQPFPGERDYYRTHPDVASMAGEDNQISINPFKEVSPADSASLIQNERVRIWLDKTGYEPKFELTPEQKSLFADYGRSAAGAGTERDRRATVLARIIAGDPSMGRVTPEQEQEAQRVQSLMAPMPPSGPLDRFQSAPSSTTGVAGVGPSMAEQSQNAEAMERFAPKVSQQPLLPEFLRQPVEDLTRQETADTMRNGLLANMVGPDVAATAANLSKLPFSLVRGIADQYDQFSQALSDGQVAEAGRIATEALAGLVPGRYAIKAFQAAFGDKEAQRELRGQEFMPALDLLFLGGIAGLAKWGRTAREAARPWEKPLSKAMKENARKPEQPLNSAWDQATEPERIAAAEQKAQYEAALPGYNRWKAAQKEARSGEPGPVSSGGGIEGPAAGPAVRPSSPATSEAGISPPELPPAPSQPRAGSAISRRPQETTARPETPTLLTDAIEAAPPLVETPAGMKIVKVGDILVEIEKDVKAPGMGQFVTSPSNYLGAIPGQKPRFAGPAGEAAVSADRSTLLRPRDQIVEFGGRQERLQAVIDKVAKEDYGKEGEVFFDLLEEKGRTIDDIMADPNLQPGTKVAAQEQRASLDADKLWLRDDLRARNRGWVEKEVEYEYRQELRLKKGERLGPKYSPAEAERIVESGEPPPWELDEIGFSKRGEVGPARKEISRRVDARLAEIVPDNWGIENYLTHMFPGDFLIRFRGQSGWETVGSATTKLEAKGKLAGIARDLGERNSNLFQITHKEFRDPDMVRLSKGNYFRLKGELEKALEVPGDEVRDAMAGKIGMRQSRVKFAGMMKHRTGAEGYTKNFPEAMTMYNAAISRYKHLTQMSREVTPLIEAIRKDNPGLADYTQKVFDQAWGQKPNIVSLAFDNTLKGMGLGNVVKPFALDRWLSTFVKWPVATFKWKLSPRAQLLNFFQPYQETLAVVDAATFVRGEAFYHSAAGKAALEEHGIRFFSAGKLREVGPSFTSARFREKMGALAPETRNQELTWSILYKDGLDKGMTAAEASDYAFLRGNVFTQFVHMPADVPPIMRGPIGSTLLMFKRFTVKDIELGLDILKRGDFPAAGKYFGAKAMLGGLKAITHPVSLLAGGGYLTLEAYRKLKEKYGEQTANFVAYGLPGLVGLDMSYSVQVDVPMGDNAAEKVGNVVLGAPGSSILQVGRAISDTKGTEESGILRAVEALKQTNPGVGRLIDGIYKLSKGADDQGLYDFRTPSGKLKYQGDLKDLVIYALGGKTIGNKIVTDDGGIIEDEPFDLWLESNAEMMARRSAAMDKIVAKAIKDPEYDMWPAMDEWNQKWPEFPIDFKSLRIRRNSRIDVRDKTQRERALEAMPKGMKPYYEGDEE